MSNLKKKSVGISPFNCIAMKDIKDKNSKKGDLRPLFDCVSSLGECVEKLHSYLDSSPDQEEVAQIDSYVQTLTKIEVDLLALCQGKVSRQNEYVPSQNEEPEIVQEDPALMANNVPEVKSKIKV